MCAVHRDLGLRRPGDRGVRHQFGNAIRVDGKLTKRMFELMVLIVARHGRRTRVVLFFFFFVFWHEDRPCKGRAYARRVEALRTPEPGIFCAPTSS